jgi:dTDP-4-amino-4,6-dideoxygalactose transaminase
MGIPLVDLKAQYAQLKPEVDAAIQRVLDNTSFILGQEVSNFEQAFANYIGVTGAVGIASGTAALHLSLLACGVGPGDEVITTAHTFFATAEMISHTGARPIFVDIDPRTYNLDPNRVEAAITPRTRAIVPVHLYGQPAQMDSLLEIAQRHNLWLIEDAAQAHGATFKGRHCGAWGHLACFSFYPGKNLGAYGDGGMVTGADETLLAKVRLWRNHGRTQKYEHEEIGWGERLDALQAAILGVKLNYLEQWTEARRNHAAVYNQLLEQTEVLRPYEEPQARHVYHLYVIRTARRDEMLTFLKRRGIEAGVHYPIPLHRQPAYLKQGYSNTHLPVTEAAAAEVLSLPLYPELTRQQIEVVVAAIKEFTTHG